MSDGIRIIKDRRYANRHFKKSDFPFKYWQIEMMNKYQYTWPTSDSRTIEFELNPDCTLKTKYLDYMSK